MTVTEGVIVWLAATILVSLISATDNGSRFSLFACVVLLPLPELTTAPLPIKVVIAFLVIVLFVGTVDFVFGRRPLTFQGRISYIFGWLLLADTNCRKPAPRRLDTSGALQILCALACGAVAILAWPLVETLSQVTRYFARGILAAIIVLSLAELTSGFVRLASAASASALPPVHDSPYKSRTLSEFWSGRWNLVMASWLKRHCFLPLRRYGAALALAATFAVSACFHAYLFASVDWSIALSWASFFLLQPLLLLVERKINVKKWPPLLARLWTISTLILVLPLLLGPFLIIFGTSL
jgi:hypothetical protein